MKHVCDVNGVLFEMIYSGLPPVEIQSVHLLDADYRPVGPDLTHLLHDVLVMTAETEAKRFLSKLVEEIT